MLTDTDPKIVLEIPHSNHGMIDSDCFWS